MNRYPNNVGAPSLLSARGNGFLRAKWFTTPGAFSFTLPADLPFDHRGKIRVAGFVIGGGSHGDSANGGAGNLGGSGAGFSHREVFVKPGSVFSIVVGPGGLTAGSPAGATSSISIDGNAWQATGGGAVNGGQGSGGDINTNGGNRPTTTNNTIPISGSAAGSPWGNGGMGYAGNGALGAKWRVPTFWDLSEISDAAGFIDFAGIGAGGKAANAVGSGGGLGDPPSFGGGGAGGFDSNGHPGAGGLAVIYY